MRMLGKTLVSCAALALVLSAANARATTTTDAMNDFLPTFTGPHGADLDVLSTTATLVGTNLVLNATLAGAVGTTPGGLYVWGIDRGMGASTANFGSLGLSNIIFDSVVIVNPDGTGTVVLLSPSQVATPLAAGAISIAANQFTVTVPLSMLPSTGFTAANYTQNLWPRYGGLTMDSQISDFAPDDHMASISTPEPATLGLLGLSLGLVAVARRRMLPADERTRLQHG